MSSRELMNSCYYQQVIGIPAALSHHMRTGSPPELRPESLGRTLAENKGFAIKLLRLNFYGTDRNRLTSHDTDAIRIAPTRP